MSSNKRYKPKSSGLRILWIPGRKRNNQKGQYVPTSKHVDYSKRQKPSQIWSLGGGKAQHELVRSGLSDIPEASSVAGLIPSAYAAGAICSTSADAKMKLEDESNRFAILGQDANSDANGVNTGKHSLNEDEEPLAADKNCLKETKNEVSLKEDINSIQCINENGSTRKKLPEDVTDACVVNSNIRSNSKKRKQKKKKKKYDDDNSTEDKDEKTVRCLYYTLMCCECTIS